jgi:hypothetical protein
VINEARPTQEKVVYLKARLAELEIGGRESKRQSDGSVRTLAHAVRDDASKLGFRLIAKKADSLAR